MHVYEVIKRPVITEKSYDAADFNNQYTFEVDTRANKHQIRDAVETAFRVNVENVRGHDDAGQDGDARASQSGAEVALEEGGCHFE